MLQEAPWAARRVPRGCGSAEVGALARGHPTALARPLLALAARRARGFSRQSLGLVCWAVAAAAPGGKLPARELRIVPELRACAVFGSTAALRRPQVVQVISLAGPVGRLGYSGARISRVFWGHEDPLQEVARALARSPLSVDHAHLAAALISFWARGARTVGFDVAVRPLRVPRAWGGERVAIVSLRWMWATRQDSGLDAGVWQRLAQGTKTNGATPNVLLGRGFGR